jgi:hypothetical protein
MTPTSLDYSIDQGQNYVQPTNPVVNNSKIAFSAFFDPGLNALATFRIRLRGIVNPPTENPSGNFIVSTYD